MFCNRIPTQWAGCFMMHDFHTLFFQSSKKTKGSKKYLYIISSYFLHFCFFPANGQNVLWLKEKNSESVQCIQLKITAHHKLEMSQKQQQAPRRINIAAGNDQANDSIQCKCSLKTNPKSEIPPFYFFLFKQGNK